MSSDLSLDVSDLGKVFHIYDYPQQRIWQSLWRGRRTFYKEKVALRDITFSVGKGETVGVIGANGAGKSTLLGILSGLVTPTSGTCRTSGRICTLLDLGTGFNQTYTGVENVYLAASILGFSREQIDERREAIADFADIGDAIDQPVKYYSTGMYLRLAFALAVHLDPDVLIIDEHLAVGDEAFQSKCYAHLREQRRQGVSIVFVSHSSALVGELSDRVLLLNEGELLAFGEPNTVIAEYQRLVFAPLAEQAAIHRRLLARQGLQGVGPSDEPLGEVNGVNYDADLEQVQTVSYVRQGAEITTAWITDERGSRVNLLVARERYCYHYRVRFERDVRRVRFGMMVKGVSGLDVGGCETGDRPIDVLAGQEYVVAFHFSCYLTPGVYFLNAGVLGPAEGMEIFLDRKVDLIQFRVLPNAHRHTGTADLGVEFAVKAL